MNIVSWNNTKTNNLSLVFQVTNGDIITFSVNTDTIPEKYIWYINQKETSIIGNIFTYNVLDDGLINYEIAVRVIDYGMPVIGIDLSKFSLNTWNITKSIIRQVTPSGDINGISDTANIQEAINQVNTANGGIIELLTGTFYINDNIWIGKSNTTLVGQGKTVTYIIQKTNDKGGITVCFQKDWQPIWKYAFDPYWKYPDIFQKFIINDANVIKNITISKLYIYFPDSGTSNMLCWAVGIGDTIYCFGGIVLMVTKNSIVSQNEVEGNNLRNTPYGIKCNFYIDSTITDNIIHGTGEAIETGYVSVIPTIQYNYIYDNKQGRSIEFNGAVGYDTGLTVWDNNIPKIPAKIIGNIIIQGTTPYGSGMIYCYSSTNALITNNVIDGIYSSNAIFVHASYDWSSKFAGTKIHTSKNEVKNNVIKNKTGQSSGTCNDSSTIYYCSAYEYNSDIDILNNLIYNTATGPGILISRAGGSGLINRIENNTIYNNNGNGIQRTIDSLITGDIKNNIVVECNGIGINTPIHSYNNSWNNVEGNYSGGVSTGDISTDSLFANLLLKDFHLKSLGGRWNGTLWVQDAIASPCIDAGDPLSNYSNELLPNGNRINMGVYGNTKEASLSGVDIISPSIVLTDPINNATNIPSDKIINITFSENIIQDINYNTIELKDTSNNNVIITKSINNNILSISHIQEFQYDTIYILNIPAQSVKDVFNNSLSTTQSITFTTSAQPILSSIIINPKIASVSVGTTKQFTAESLDQFGNHIYTLFLWNNSNSVVGSINSNGLFSAITEGTTIITVSSKTLLDTATITVTPPAQDLVIGLSFDETSGNLAYDSSSNENNGTLINVNRVQGIIGNAIQLNGTDSYVDITNLISLPNGITIMCYLKSNGVSSVDTIYSLGNQSNIEGFEWLYLYSNRLYLQSSTGTEYVDSSVVLPITIGIWYHIAVTVNYNTKEIKYYLGGVQIGTQTYTTNHISVVSKSSKIGSYNGSINHLLNGEIDNFKLFNRDLTQTEITNEIGVDVCPNPICIMTIT